jgi:hypothetical protein
MAIDPRHLRILMAKIRYRAPEPSRGGGRFHGLYPADDQDQKLRTAVARASQPASKRFGAMQMMPLWWPLRLVRSS